MQLYIAAYGWTGPQWVEDFFPGDLPEEWRFDYYANEFRALVLPYEFWRRLDVDTLRQWREGACEGFSFFLDWLPGEAGADEATLLPVVAALGETLRGLIVHGGVRPDWLPTGLPCCLLCPEGAAHPRSLEAADGLTVCRQHTPAGECVGGELAVAELSGRLEPRELKAVIDRMLSGTQGMGVILSTDLVNLRTVRTLCELMGV